LSLRPGRKTQTRHASRIAIQNRNAQGRLRLHSSFRRRHSPCRRFGGDLLLDCCINSPNRRGRNRARSFSQIQREPRCRGGEVTLELGSILSRRDRSSEIRAGSSQSSGIAHLKCGQVSQRAGDSFDRQGPERRFHAHSSLVENTDPASWWCLEEVVCA
jgi:hypothetical protein